MAARTCALHRALLSQLPRARRARVAPPTPPQAAAAHAGDAASERPERVDKLLANNGVCSRREARDFVKSGRVTLREQQPGRRLSPDEKVSAMDLLVDGEPLDHPGRLLILMHKPAGYVCTADEREGRRALDLLPTRWADRTPPVTTIGRLDKDTTGVLLLTNDGALVHAFTAPSRRVVKVYEVEVDADIPDTLPALFARGKIELDGERCLPAEAVLTGPRSARVELTEGRYHQVKRMFAAAGLTVTRLHRSRFGDYDLTLGGRELGPGEWAVLPLP